MLEKLLLDLGGKALPRLVASKWGAEAGELTKIALEALGQAFGVPPEPAAIEREVERVATADPAQARNAVAYAEMLTAEQLLGLAEVMRAGNEQQRQTNELLMAQLKQPGWRSDWLYVWQWLLMGFWLWTLLLVHIANAAIRLLTGGADTGGLPAPDIAMLTTLTGMYLALHMGGHTVLELMRGGALRAHPRDGGE